MYRVRYRFCTKRNQKQETNSMHVFAHAYKIFERIYIKLFAWGYLWEVI